MTVTRRPTVPTSTTAGVEAFISGAPDASAPRTSGRGRPRTVEPDSEQLVSVRLDSALYRQAKLLAVRDGITMKELLASALTREVANRSTDS